MILVAILAVPARSGGGVVFQVSGSPNPEGLVTKVISASRIDLSWTDSTTTETGFRITRRPTTGTTRAMVTIVPSNVTRYEDSGLTPATSYIYSIAAIVPGRSLAIPVQVVATTPAERFEAPMNLVAKAVSASRVDLGWTDNSTTETGFKVLRRQSSGGGSVIVATIPANSTTWQDSGLTAATGYSYAVATIAASGALATSSESEVVTKATDSPQTLLATLRPEGGSNSPASGYSAILLSADEKTATIRFTYSNLTTPETSAHIHGPADPGQSGQILFDLDTAPRQQDGSVVWKIENIGALTVDQIVAALKGGRLYINIHSARYPSGEIRGHFNVVTGSQSFTPPPSPPASWTGTSGIATERDAARFLTQATFGPTNDEIIALQRRGQNGLSSWLEDQFNLPVTSHLDYLDVTTAGKQEIYQQEMMESFWMQAVKGPDQLRQRIVFALSQILVVSFRSNLESEPFAIAGYLDTLNRQAFGNFRQLLEAVALSPAMGRYLDHLQNDKEDPATGRNPNENFARELLQLFSIGLYRLHPDGSLMLDGSGLPMTTYDQEVVKGFSQVFTGWSYGWFPVTEQNWWWPNVWKNGTAFWRVPMQAWESHHSTSTKVLLNGVTLPANQTPAKDLKDALDNIFQHPNLGPFIAHRLIQRLVTSNPSPGYIYRVSQKFNDNGRGVRGDMKAVIRAILLDYEARSLDLTTNQGYGKLREPVLRFSHLLRAFNFSCPCGTYPIYWMDSPDYAIGQNPLRSPTVFNFFEPGYSHPGAIGAAGLTSPEFQITSETSMIGISTFLHYVVRDGFNWEKDKPLIPDYSALTPLASTPAQLIGTLDRILTAGGMSSELKQKLIDEISRMRSNDPAARVKMAIHLVLTSPDYAIQR